MSSLLSVPRFLAQRTAHFNRAKPYPATVPRPDGPSKRWGRSLAVLARRRVRVVDVARETDDVVTLHLEATDGQPIQFLSGQYLTHCFEIGGVTVKRAYSICAAEGDRLACAVKAIDGGVVSGFVHRSVAVGYEYTVLGASGDFVLPRDDSVPLAFLAAGSGITPVIAMIETALRRSPTRVISLVYASRRQNQIIFADRLSALVKKHPQLQVVHVLSQPRAGWSGETGRLTGERARGSAGRSARCSGVPLRSNGVDGCHRDGVGSPRHWRRPHPPRTVLPRRRNTPEPYRRNPTRWNFAPPAAPSASGQVRRFLTPSRRRVEARFQLHRRRLRSVQAQSA